MDTNHAEGNILSWALMPPKKVIVCLLLLTLMVSAAKEQTNLLRSENGSVQFTSQAPLELIRAKSRALRGVIDLNENSFAFAIEMKSFDGFNSDLQRTHFNENYLESQKYPRATFTGKIIEKIDWNSIGLVDVRAKGMLEIHGVKQERIIPSRVEIFADRILIQADFTVPLKDHDISIPKLVAQKISERINVKIEFTILHETSVN